MDIKHSQPIAGKPFQIEVRVGNKWAQLNVFLDEERLFSKRFECPDPPCHENIVLELKSDAKGKHLFFEGKDPDGPKTIKAIVE